MLRLCLFFIVGFELVAMNVVSFEDMANEELGYFDTSDQIDKLNENTKRLKNFQKLLMMAGMGCFNDKNLEDKVKIFAFSYEKNLKVKNLLQQKIFLPLGMAQIMYSIF